MSDEDGKVVQLRQGLDAVAAFIRASSFGGSFARPFVGQRHMFTGERGARPLPSMRYRDLGDMLVEVVGAFAQNEVRVTGECDVRKMDLDALAQMLLRRIEENGESWPGLTENKR